MKKKLVLVVIFFVELILFLENVCKISVFENIGNFIDKQDKMSDSIEENVTRIDVTGILPGEETEHEHLYKTMYDENKHWEECTVCKEKRNENIHSYKRTWLLGYESCEVNNAYKDTCSCGYSISGHKPCIWDGKSVLKWFQIYQHRRVCTQCHGQIGFEYYWNNKLYGSELYCHLANGERISCKNIGTCQICGYSYTSASVYHDLYVNDNGEIQCILCNGIFGECETYVEHTLTRPIQYKITQNIKLQNGATFGKINSTSYGKIGF